MGASVRCQMTRCCCHWQRGACCPWCRWREWRITPRASTSRSKLHPGFRAESWEMWNKTIKALKDSVRVCIFRLFFTFIYQTTEVSLFHLESLTLFGTLLLQFVLPFTWQRCAGAPETTNVWNQVPKWSLLQQQPSFWLRKLAKNLQKWWLH